MPRVIFNIEDFGGEKSSVGFNINALANVAALQTDVDAVTLGEIRTRTEIAAQPTVSNAAVTSPFAQVELGLRIHLLDSVNGDTGYVTIPCPDLANLSLVGDEVNLADAGIMAALVTEIETNVLSRDGNAVTVTRAEVVGRNR